MELLLKFKVAVCKFMRKSNEWILHKATKFKFSVVLNYSCFHGNDRNLKLNLMNKMPYKCILAASNLSFVPAESLITAP